MFNFMGTVKISLRWYFSPAIISRFNPQLPDCCWRLCGERGDLLHILWNCPKLLHYWSNVFQVISEMSQIQILPTPALAILSLGIDQLPYTLQHSIIQVLLYARLLLTRNWKNTAPPTITDVIDLTHLHCTYERTVASSSGRLNIFHNKWWPWISWYIYTEITTSL